MAKKIKDFFKKPKNVSGVDLVKTEEKEVKALPQEDKLKIDIVEDKPLTCPTCGSAIKFRRVKGNDYHCDDCGHGVSGFPPPRK